MKMLIGLTSTHPLKKSVKKLIEDKIAKFGATSIFQIKQSEIGTPGGGLIMINYNLC